MKNLITYIIISITIILMTMGCYSEKRSLKHLYRSQAKHPQNVAAVCSRLYPPVELVRDSLVFVEGEETTETVFVEVDCDSAIKVQQKIVRIAYPKLIKRVDTVFRYKFKQVVNRAEIEMVRVQNLELNSSLVEMKKERNILLYISMVLGCYTLLRFVLRFWNIKLP